MKHERPDKEYFHLIAEEKKLRDSMKEVILLALKENSSRITFVPEDEDSEYPVIATLWGKHDSPNIEISDVYLGKQDAIFADGYEYPYGIFEKGFEIYPEQYWDITHFIAAVLGWKNTAEEEEKEQEENPLEITVLFGSNVICEYSDTGELPSKEWLEENGGVIDTKTFESKELMNAYLEGLNDADGWLETLVLDDFMKKLLAQNRKINNKNN
jgi:hypothetical protein